MKKAIVWMGVVVLFALFFSYRYEKLSRRGNYLPPVMTDKNRNGFPDEMELYREDAKNFYNWFSSIAVSQYYVRSKNWRSSFDSCSGLLRFCFIEALKKHTPYWFSRFPYLFRADISSVKKYNYPDVPVVGVNVFRVGRKSFSKNTTLNQIVELNLKKVRKSMSDLEAGDMLVFRTKKGRYRVLIYGGMGIFVYQRCVEQATEIVLLKGLPVDKGLQGIYNWIVVHRGEIEDGKEY